MVVRALDTGFASSVGPRRTQGQSFKTPPTRSKNIPLRLKRGTEAVDQFATHEPWFSWHSGDFAPEPAKQLHARKPVHLQGA